ncbi:MAG: MFS transporter [Candidatus Syntropharchaeia archaeon]
MSRRFFILYAGAFLGPLGGTAVLSLIPSIKNAFDVDVFLATLSITCLMGPYAFIQLFSGAISDVYDRKKVLFVGFFVYAIGSFFCAISPEIDVFLIFRVVQGIGFGFVTPPIISILGEISKKGEMGRTMGWLGVAHGSGIFMGPVLAGFLAIIDWRLTFYLFCLFSILIALSFRKVFAKDSFPVKKGGINSVFLQIGSTINDKNVILLCLTGSAVFVSYIGVNAFISDYLSLPPILMKEYEIGIIISSAGLSRILSSPLSGTIVDRIGTRRCAFSGLILMASVVSSLSLENSFYSFLILFLLFGIGNSLVWTPLNVLSVELIPDSKGSVTSLYNAFRYTGYALAPVILSSIYIGGGIGLLYLVCALLLLACIPLIYLIKFD